MSETLCILGSTGSIGTQVLEVIRHFPERFQVETLTGGKKLALLAHQAELFQPKQVVIQDPEDIPAFKTLAPDFKGRLLAGEEALVEVSQCHQTDTVVVGLVGMIGLAPTLAALQHGKKVLTANKETFVAGGQLVQPYLRQIIPLDSEHSAIFQCLKNEPRNAVERLILTASGGPFRNFSQADIQNVTREEALAHPNWVMGPKISIDSATMMNKGLEVIEAHWLFGIAIDRIQIVVHPQSILHSGVAFIDGSILFQAGCPDMRTPIQYGLFYPDRVASPFLETRLDLFSIGQLELSAPDPARFPCIKLAYEAGRIGGTAPAVLNAADEAAVNLFLEEKIGFTDIARVIEQTLIAHENDFVRTPNLETIKTVDRWARRFVIDAAKALKPPAMSV